MSLVSSKWFGILPPARRAPIALRRGYDAAGKVTLRRRSNGTRTSYVYDANDRRTAVDNRTSAGAAIATFDYLYDQVGNPTRVVEASGDRVTWSYDADNKLLSERRSGASSYANTFTYDAVGNRTLKNDTTERTTFAYDSANQLFYSQATAGRTTFSYDTAGNQTLEQPPVGARTTTTWNYENQPSVVLLPDATRMTLAYNPDNRRVQRQRDSETLKFVWDPVADAYQSELDASNVTQAVYTQPPVTFGQLISQRRSTTSSWFHPDSLGSTRALTGSSQATTDTYLYDAWGNPLSSTGTTVNPFRWVGNVGYYFDTASGLYYIRARLYQPTIARWTSADPLFYMLARSGMIGFSSNEGGRNRAGLDLYNYGLSVPTRYRDASGLTCDDLTLTVTTNPQNAARTPFAFVHIPDVMPDGRIGRVVGRTDWKGTLSCTCDECGTVACPCVQIVDCKLHFDFFIRVDLRDILELELDPIGTLGHEQRHVQNHLNWIRNTLEPLLYDIIAADDCSERGGALGKLECDLRVQALELGLQRLILHEMGVEAGHSRPDPKVKGDYPLLPPEVGPNDASPTIPDWIK